MPGTLAYAGEDLGIDYLFDADCAVLLSTTTVSPDGTGLTAPTGTWYTVKDITFGVKSGNNPSTKSNSVEIDYGNSDEDVTLVSWVIQRKTGGAYLSVGNFTPNVSVQNGNPVKIPVGNIVVTLT